MVLSNGFFYERIQLDTINERFNKVPTAKEGDANGRGMIVVLTENGLVKNTTGVSLLFKWEHTRISGAQGLEDFEPLDLTKGEYIVTYPTEMNHEGYVKAEIRIIDNGKYAGSRNMKIQVEPSVGDDTAMESSNQFSALVTALLEVNSWNARIDAVEADFIQRANYVESTYALDLLSVKQQLAEIMYLPSSNDGVTDDTNMLQDFIDNLSSTNGRVFAFNPYKTYAFSTLKIPSNTIVKGNFAKIIPINNPQELFLLDTSEYDGQTYFNTGIYDIDVWGSVNYVVRLVGSNWVNIEINNIKSSKGSGTALVKTEIDGSKNPSGLIIKRLYCIRSNVYKYGWHSTSVADHNSMDTVNVEQIYIWAKAEGWAVKVEHKISTNSFIDKLYLGGGTALGGGVLYVYQMEKGDIGQLWNECNKGYTTVLGGSYRSVNVKKMIVQTNSITEIVPSTFVNAHMFDVNIGTCHYADESGSGYERDTSPPADYKCFVFLKDKANHISRDVQIMNRQGNFNEGHLDRGTSQGIRYVGKPGGHYLVADYVDKTYTTANQGISTSPGIVFKSFSNWEWGYLNEGIKLVILGKTSASIAKEIRVKLAGSADIATIVTDSSGSFKIESHIKTYNNGTNRLLCHSTVYVDDTVTHSAVDFSNAWVRDNTRKTNLNLFLKTMDASDSITLNSIIIEPIRSTVS